MAKLFMIECFCFTNDQLIEVVTDKGTQYVSKEKFEAWIDRTDRRMTIDNTVLDWDVYYGIYAEWDLYEYLVVRTGSSLLLGIKISIDKCLN